MFLDSVIPVTKPSVLDRPLLYMLEFAWKYFLSRIIESTENCYRCPFWFAQIIYLSFIILAVDDTCGNSTADTKLTNFYITKIHIIHV